MMCDLPCQNTMFTVFCSHCQFLRYGMRALSAKDNQSAAENPRHSCLESNRGTADQQIQEKVKTKFKIKLKQIISVILCALTWK